MRRKIAVFVMILSTALLAGCGISQKDTTPKCEIDHEHHEVTDEEFEAWLQEMFQYIDWDEYPPGTTGVIEIN